MSSLDVISATSGFCDRVTTSSLLPGGQKELVSVYSPG